MHAFIVRPFGVKNGIDFDRVERDLIRPALGAPNISGGTTGEFIQQGNIRTDMFEQLLTADLVVADISVHNANVFYELGIRHALRDKRTFLVRAEGDQVPFDLKTDQYLHYDASNPAACFPELTEALAATLRTHKQDSPVFQLLPGLEAAAPGKFILVPLSFREEVRRAEEEKKRGHLQMLAAEADGFAWTTMGLRAVGHAQFRLCDWPGAKATWEAVRKCDDMDVEANILLGTIYQRLGDLVRSDQALERALANRCVSSWNRAECKALMARNAKTRWEADWRCEDKPDTVRKEAFNSPHLERSLDLYRQGFAEDRNHFYSGLNALAMATIRIELAKAQPAAWSNNFDTEDAAALELQQLKELCVDLAAGVRLAIESRQTVAAREGQNDIWTEISAADLDLLSAVKSSRVGRAYKKALAGAPDFAAGSVRKQHLLYQHLGVLVENTRAALDSIPVILQGDNTPEESPHVILFTGHRVDAPDRRQRRFPPDREDQARTMIMKAVSNVKEKTEGKLLGIAGGASGGDILFHEVCGELGIPSRMYLVLSKYRYIAASVADGGPRWVERFKRLCAQNPPEILSDDDKLPCWLRAKKDYSVWQRSNLWMLHGALAISNDNLTLIALWNGATGDGPGGTEDMVRRAQSRGATFVHLDARKLIE
ncbi:MAG: tetratricopeptide repeat-containing protein [Desulfobacterales bacterium]